MNIDEVVRIAEQQATIVAHVAFNQSLYMFGDPENRFLDAVEWIEEKRFQSDEFKQFVKEVNKEENAVSLWETFFSVYNTNLCMEYIRYMDTLNA